MPYELVKRGRRKPAPHEGYWKCLGCQSVYRVDRAGSPELHYQENDRPGGSDTMDGPCEICGGTTAWIRTQAPPDDDQRNAGSGWQERE